MISTIYFAGVLALPVVFGIAYGTGLLDDFEDVLSFNKAEDFLPMSLLLCTGSVCWPLAVPLVLYGAGVMAGRATRKWWRF